MSDDFTRDLIKSLNKDQGVRVAYNLAVDESPTHVRRWISTGSKLLDYICSNRENGGLPEGRIVEIFGPPSIGKSHIATQIAKNNIQIYEYGISYFSRLYYPYPFKIILFKGPPCE